MRDRDAELRQFYAQIVAARAGVADERVMGAFRAVPRDVFAGPGPWSVAVFGPEGSSYVQTPDDDPTFLYQDVLIALDPTRRINIGEPSLHARCLTALALQPGETAVQVGAGSGYYSAILAELTGPTGRVVAFEIDPALAARAEANLRPWPWARVEARSGAEGTLPAADVIYVNAGVTQPRLAWLEALQPGGRVLFPLQPVPGFGGMLQVTKPAANETAARAGAWPARFVSRAGFIGCSTEQDEAAGRALADAFAGGGWAAVQSLRLGGSPDQTSWVAASGWWLSTADA